MSISAHGRLAIAESLTHSTLAVSSRTLSLRLLILGIASTILVNSKTKAFRLNVAVTPDEKSTEARLGQEVEDTVENGFTVR